MGSEHRWRAPADRVATVSALIVVALIALVAGGWWLSQRHSGKQARSAALAALGDIRDASEAGISVGQFRQELLRAKQEIRRAEERDPHRGEFWEHVTKALRHWEFRSRVELWDDFVYEDSAEYKEAVRRYGVWPDSEPHRLGEGVRLRQDDFTKFGEKWALYSPGVASAAEWSAFREAGQASGCK